MLSESGPEVEVRNEMVKVEVEVESRLGFEMVRDETRVGFEEHVIAGFPNQNPNRLKLVRVSVRPFWNALLGIILVWTQ